MANKNKNLKTYLTSTVYASTLEIMKSLKISYIWGSKMAYFGISQSLSPLAGLFGGAKASVFVFMARSAISLILTKLTLFSTAFLHLPTFFGSLYLANQSRILRAIVPLICLIIFNLHPTGQQAFLYSTYWVIPIIISILKPKSIILQSIGATFNAHAVGSIIWLLNDRLTILEWNTLINIVWLERLTFAMCLTTAYYTIIYTKKYGETIYKYIYQKINTSLNTTE